MAVAVFMRVLKRIATFAAAFLHACRAWWQALHSHAARTSRAANLVRPRWQVDRAAIAKIERNLRYVANYELAALAKTFAVSPVRLLCWD